MPQPTLAGRTSAFRRRLLGLEALALLAARSAVAGAEASDEAFVGEHCSSCNDDVNRKGRLELTGLAFDPSDASNLAVWVKVHDRVKAGEMPPGDRPRPDAARKKAFVDGLARSIAAAERAALAGEGRAVQSRLNRHEYENTLRDLLRVPWAQIADRLPEDGEAYHFNKSGEALDVSYLQVARWFFEGQGAEKAPVYHTLLWHLPNLDEVYPGRRNEPIGVYAQGGGQTRPVGAVDFTPRAGVSEVEVFLLANKVLRTDGTRLFRTRVNGTEEQFVNPLATEEGMPGYAIQEWYMKLLANLFVSMLQRLGLEETSFGPSTGTMRGLETD
jgi:hypothetical protein